MDAETLWLHQRELLTLGRCPRCAERLAPSCVLRADPCPRCGVRAEWPGTGATDGLVEAVVGRWRKSRPLMLALFMVITLVVGLIPLLAGLARLVGLVVVHFVYLRPALAWLSWGRRATTKLALKLWLVVVALLSWAVDVLVAPLPLAGAVISALVSGGAVLLFAEGALHWLTSRARRQARGPGLDTWEWLLPVGLFAAVLGLVLAVIGALSLGAHILFEPTAIKSIGQLFGREG
jgi:hypothetical protein